MARTTTDPATGLHTALGIDVGGTGMKGGVVQLGDGPGTGQLVGKRFRIPTPRPAVPGSVAEVLAQITAELDARPEAPPAALPVGVDFPAVIQNGICRTATNIDPSWIGTDVDGLFSEHLKRPVTTINDADAAGLAEVRFGAGKGVPGTVLVITLGTGIGSGLFRDGELVPNVELGTIELDGAIAEQRASAAAREREGLDWPEYAERLQRYFSYVEGIFSPDLFIVGGGISKRPQDYLPRLRLRTPIVPATLQNNAGIVGAALWATDVMAQSSARRAVLDTARHAADQEMARQAEADAGAGAEAGRHGESGAAVREATAADEPGVARSGTAARAAEAVEDTAATVGADEAAETSQGTSGTAEGKAGTAKGKAGTAKGTSGTAKGKAGTAKGKAGRAKGKSGRGTRSEPADAAERASHLRTRAVRAGKRAAKAEKRATKAEKAAAKAERRAARESRAIHKAMEKAIRKSGR